MANKYDDYPTDKTGKRIGTPYASRSPKNDLDSLLDFYFAEVTSTDSAHRGHEYETGVHGDIAFGNHEKPRGDLH